MIWHTNNNMQIFGYHQDPVMDYILPKKINSESMSINIAQSSKRKRLKPPSHNVKVISSIIVVRTFEMIPNLLNFCGTSFWTLFCGRTSIYLPL